MWEFAGYFERPSAVVRGSCWPKWWSESSCDIYHYFFLSQHFFNIQHWNMNCLLSAEPPSYDSLFGRIRDTHKASRNVIDFVVKVKSSHISFKAICWYLANQVILLLLGTIGCTIACSITIVIPVCTKDLISSFIILWLQSIPYLHILKLLL